MSAPSPEAIFMSVSAPEAELGLIHSMGFFAAGCQTRGVGMISGTTSLFASLERATKKRSCFDSRYFPDPELLSRHEGPQCAPKIFMVDLYRDSPFSIPE